MTNLLPIYTHRAPAAIGPYSQAIRVGNLLFCSGQIPLDPTTGLLVQSTIAEETERALLNLLEVVAAGGSSSPQVVKTTVYLVDMADFPAVNEVYARFFDKHPAPARATVAVHQLPKGARVEIDAIAIID